MINHSAEKQVDARLFYFRYNNQGEIIYYAVYKRLLCLNSITKLTFKMGFLAAVNVRTG